MSRFRFPSKSSLFFIGHLPTLIKLLFSIALSLSLVFCTGILNVIIIIIIIIIISHLHAGYLQLYRMSIKSFPDYKHGHVGTLRCTSVRRVSAVDHFPTRCCTSTLGFGCSSVFGCNISKKVDWQRWSDTLATTIAGYHTP